MSFDQLIYKVLPVNVLFNKLTSFPSSILARATTGEKNEILFIEVYLLQVVFREICVCVFVSDELQFI